MSLVNQAATAGARTHKLALAVAASVALLASSPAQARSAIDFADAPEGFIPPRLHPAGAELVRRELGPGVHALVSTKPGVNNVGFVVGERDWQRVAVAVGATPG